MTITQTSSTMSSRLYGKDLKAYEDLDVDTLLSRLTAEELEELNNEVDPDVSTLSGFFCTSWKSVSLFFRIRFCHRRSAAKIKPRKNQRDRTNANDC